jgi:hypothetical protein
MPFSFGDSPIFAGQSAQVSCFVTEGDQPLKITWTLSSNIDINRLGISTTKLGSKTSVLSIDYVDSQHSGTYTCIAENSAGSSKFSTDLEIHGKFNHNSLQNYRSYTFVFLVSSFTHA